MEQDNLNNENNETENINEVSNDNTENISDISDENIQNSADISSSMFSDENTEIVNSENTEEEQTIDSENGFVTTAISEEENVSESEDLITVRPVQFQDFKTQDINKSMKRNLDILHDISMHISVEIGRTHSSIKEIMELEKGSIVELNKIAGEQVEVYVGNKLIAKGEVIVIEDKFGVRITTTNIKKAD